MKIRALLCGATVGAFVFASSARSQEVPAELRIRLTGTDGAPVSGALVGLLDAHDSVVAEGLSTEAGARLLRASPGVYRVRVRRVGYRPFFSGPVSLPRSGELSLNVESARVVLESIVVNSKSQCGRNDPNAVALATVWDEIDKALRSSQLTMADLSGIGRARVYRKDLGINGTVISADSSVFSITDRRPFGAIDPAALANAGYVVGDEDHGWNYFGPDETVLLSEQFAATHCFRLVRQADRAGQIGVSFEPIPQRKLADIRGVLWVDQQTSQLREIMFRFVNAGVLSRFEAGGFTRFRRVPSGTWIVDEWNISVPRLELRQSPPLPPQYVSIGRTENGGGTLGPVASMPKGRGSSVVSGIVYDSVTHMPLAEAVVWLDTASVKSDADGRFEFLDVRTGTHQLSFTHQALSDLGYLSLEREIDVRSDTLHLTLATPSLRTIWMRFCHATKAVEDKGVLHGLVRDDSGQPVNASRVTISWTEEEPRRNAGLHAVVHSLEVTSDHTGHYAACGFPRPSQGSIAASSGRLTSTARGFAFEGPVIVRRDLTLLPSAAQTDTLSRKH